MPRGFCCDFEAISFKIAIGTEREREEEIGEVEFR